MAAPSLRAETIAATPTGNAQAEFDTGTYEAVIKNGASENNSTKIRVQIYPSNTYFASIQNSGRTDYTRGTWEQAGGYIILTEDGGNTGRPFLSLGLDKRWNRVAGAQWAYTKDTKKAVLAWAEVEKRCPFWTEKFATYGVGIAITPENRSKAKSIDLSPLEGARKIADRQTSDALKQFFNTEKATKKWQIAADYVTESYNNQNAVYENLGRTLDAAGIEPFELTRTVPQQCGAPDLEIPSARDYGVSSASEDQDVRLTDRQIPNGVAGIHIYDADLGKAASGDKVTAIYSDDSAQETMTNEYGWAFFDLAKGQKITALKMQIQHDDGKQTFTKMLPVSLESTGVQDIHMDQIQTQRPLLGSLTLRIDQGDLITTIEGLVIRLSPDSASQKYAE